MSRKVDPRERRELRESLETYAQRLSVKADAVRPLWRAQGLRFLDAPFPGPDTVANLEKLLRVSRVRVAPGVAVPCGPEPSEVVEVEPDAEASVNNKESKGTS